jgi:putative antirepressor protein antB|uniref:Antirepressor protein n=1 Tax=Podoviridae sp. ct4s49 TaxID=2823555 RepID=A0A8S5LEB9_9CAUD|nr:MAG TPA: antirepressor protein [Podoviridae sp. ct4s49]
MNELLTISQKNASTLTMSSREIAELVESRHDSVKRTIERLQEKGLIQLTPMVEVKNHLGQIVTEYQLIKRDTYVVVAQLSPEFTARLVDRWQELENQQKPVALIPQSFSEALMLAAQLQAEKEQNAPKVEAFDRLATATEGAMNLTNAAKHLQMQPIAFNQFLFANGWIYKRTIGSAWIAYQDKLQRGYLEHKAHPVTQSDGTEKIYPQVLVTAKGLAKLSTMLNKAAA